MEKFYRQYFNNNIDLSSQKKMDKVVLQIISRHSGSINLQWEKHETFLLTHVSQPRKNWADISLVF